jgi:hypothetical protein
LSALGTRKTQRFGQQLLGRHDVSLTPGAWDDERGLPPLLPDGSPEEMTPKFTTPGTWTKLLRIAFC